MPDAIEVNELEAATESPARGCPRCGRVVDLRSRHLVIDGSVVRAFCSPACAAATAAPDPLPPARPTLWFGLVRVGVSLPMLLLTSGYDPPMVLRSAEVAAPVAQPTVPPEPPTFGPAWPPSEKDWMAEIAGDAWIHPLDGPSRKMPIRDGRVFGAERPGDRPTECRSGHCGVDIGGDVWGEPVHAAHDGVVDRVQRGPNEDHGGQYVRLAHRDGTIFTQYFHLAAIPRRLEPGVRIKVGEVVGLLGDTGVKRSGAHLHFTVSVKPSAELAEEFIDPEPLIALWPLRFSVPGSSTGVVTASAAPGRPLGAHRPRRHLAQAPTVMPTVEAAAE